jgi:hypothetical protein
MVGDICELAANDAGAFEFVIGAGEEAFNASLSALVTS